jgi:hypothetical protein
MLYMVIERFKGGSPRPIYERLDTQGRMMPEGLVYIDSWISEDLTTCWQVMETESLDLLNEWISQWDDLVDFEVVPVMSSADARAKAFSTE